MEGRKKKASSPSSPCSSLTSELFGSRDNPSTSSPSSSSSSSSSSGIFGSIFAPPPPSKVMGRESWNDKASNTVDVDQNRGQQENNASIYQDQRVQPCHLSSSIYYGGPDVYFQPHNSTTNSTKRNDGGEDDSGSTSRGNWWKGSLYY